MLLENCVGVCIHVCVRVCTCMCVCARVCVHRCSWQGRREPGDRKGQESFTIPAGTCIYASLCGASAMQLWKSSAHASGGGFSCDGA